MTPVYVESSNIEAVGYQDDMLFIKFKSGETYSYDGVPFSYYDSLQKVESAGKFFHQFIRSKFKYHKLSFNPWAA